MDDDTRIRSLETALVECFDVAIPQAMPWMGGFDEKAEYAAKILAGHLRGLMRLHAAQTRDLEAENERLRAIMRAIEELSENWKAGNADKHLFVINKTAREALRK